VGIQAPIRITASGRIVAATPAIPGAPPRMVTKRLRNSIQVRNGNRIYVLVPYSVYLEHSKKHPHPFVQESIRRATRKGTSPTVVES